MKPHTEGAYWRYVEGCRCDPCRDANRIYQHNYRQQRKYGKLNVDTKKVGSVTTTDDNIGRQALNKTKLSIQPLLVFMDHRDDNTTGERLGTTRHNIQRWKRDGVPILRADQLACQLGVHPYIIWGNDYFKGMR